MSHKVFVYSIKKSDPFYGTICDLLQCLNAEVVDTIEESTRTVVLGGDGSVLGAARAGVKSPILVINTGHLGFLMSAKHDDYHRAIVQFLIDKFTTTSRRMLVVKQGTEEICAMNDIVIRKPVLSGLVRLSVYASLPNQPEVLVSDYRADGLIVSTPTGSTAYNLSANGPVIHPTCDVYTITPICPQGLTHRPVVVPSLYSLRIETETEGMGISIDGQIEAAVLPNMRIFVSEQRILTVDPINSYFDVLRNKLGWGKLPV